MATECINRKELQSKQTGRSQRLRNAGRNPGSQNGNVEQGKTNVMRNDKRFPVIESKSKQTIACPNCGTVQIAFVWHYRMWWSGYVHKCRRCHQYITESEWRTVRRRRHHRPITNQNNFLRIKERVRRIRERNAEMRREYGYPSGHVSYQ